MKRNELSVALRILKSDGYIQLIRPHDECIECVSEVLEVK